MNKLPLNEISINSLFFNNENKYEVPIYQRNYAWEKDEISALIQDVYDAFKIKKSVYYIGTLVSYKRDENIYEVIDGQQRLTTINIILAAMYQNDLDRLKEINNKLKYRARKKANNTIKNMPDFNVEEKDFGIVNGYKYAQVALSELGLSNNKNFNNYFLDNVHIIHYNVPKDIDLNHYFEVMNSRGEQLEKHEVIKASLISKLDQNVSEEKSKSDREKFNCIWEFCSDMSVYIQKKNRNNSLFISILDLEGETKEVNIFGEDLSNFIAESFDSINLKNQDLSLERLSIDEFIKRDGSDIENSYDIEKEIVDKFQPVINFENFLLIVLKITRIMTEKDLNPTDINLDDKEIISEFEKIKDIDSDWVKLFAYNLMKARYFLDNYIIHHANTEDTFFNNPWLLQKMSAYTYNKTSNKLKLNNLTEKNDIQQNLVHLLSMFEVSFAAKQRKNYLFYCLLYLFRQNSTSLDVNSYCNFVESLANKYFKDIYLNANCLNNINTPLPGAFDNSILSNGYINLVVENQEPIFVNIYGDGKTNKSKGIPLFVFNYLDYKIWKLYSDKLRGEKSKKGSRERIEFFNDLGCSDFELDIFNNFYFSRTRRSLEHYFPQANVEHSDLNECEINCFGNYAMIGSEANSSGSNWSPKTKLDHYLDESAKIDKISVASLKFMIMMQKCKDNSENKEIPLGEEWTFKDIENHQDKMIKILFDYYS